jgi:class 3 adenylate cyclase
MNRGAFDFLVKPVDFKDLEITLNKTIQHVRTLRRSIRFTEENSILRLFVNHGIVDRLLPMLRAADAIASETIQATVCFLEVRGLTELTHSRPPDQVVRLLNQCFEQIVPEVTARKGTLDKFTGSAVMAVFRGHGHLERALDATLAARARIVAMAAEDRHLSLAAGIQSGEMVSGGIGSRAIGRLDYTVLGEAVSTAAHLSATAARDQILIAGPLEEAVQGSFELQPRGAEALPEGERPGIVYSVVRRFAEVGPATELTVER